jgi:hypothetical protein
VFLIDGDLLTTITVFQLCMSLSLAHQFVS